MRFFSLPVTIIGTRYKTVLFPKFADAFLMMYQTAAAPIFTNIGAFGGFRHGNPVSIERFGVEKARKRRIVKQLAQNLPTAPNPSYLLCDSWYVCGKLMGVFATKGFYTVGALKSNRILYPYGMKMNVCEFAKTLSRIALFHIVTVKGRKYYVYRYEGKLNDIEKAVVLICYPVSAFGHEKALRIFICTNSDLASDEEILNLYAVRWDIEVYFRDCKNKLALDKYQIRSAKGIKRFWLISSLAYLLACLESSSFSFSEGYALLSQTILIESVSFIFDFAQNGGEKSTLLAMVA